MDALSRTRMLIGKDNVEKIKNLRVAVFGLGGVGSFVVEALVRSGVSNIAVFDNDTVSESNINRQIIATVDTIGKDKTEVIKERILSINPDAKVSLKKIFYLPETADKVDLSGFDYIVDAVDTVSAKIELIVRAKAQGIPIISCMGTGGKTDPTRLKVTDIYNTMGCPLAKVMRHELRERKIEGLKVVFSDEPFILCRQEISDEGKKGNGRLVPSSMIFVPATAGIIIAREVIFDCIK